MFEAEGTASVDDGGGENSLCARQAGAAAASQANGGWEEVRAARGSGQLRKGPAGYYEKSVLHPRVLTH